MSTSATRIRRARHLTKLTQAELASKVGVQRSAVSQWEHAVGTKPSVSNLCRIAEATAVRFEWLATGRGKMHLDESQQQPAMVMSEFALNDLESRLLLALRRMNSERKRLVIVEMVEGLTR